MNLLEKQKKIVQEFSHLSQWEKRYEKIIDLGKKLPQLENKYKTEANKVSGCQSQVWMLANINENKKIIYKADSDALIVRGLIFLLLNIYSHSSAKEIIESQTHFIQEMGLDKNLFISRMNGFYALIKKIKFYALAFQALEKKK